MKGHQLTNQFDADLGQTPANYAALTPVDFAVRAAIAHPNRIAWIYGDRKKTYREFLGRCRRFASALAKLGVGTGDAVAIMAQNGPAILEATFAIPMSGAVLTALNFRLDARSIGYMLGHCGAKVFLVDREFTEIVQAAMDQLGRPVTIIAIDDPDTDNDPNFGDMTYEAFLETGNPEARIDAIKDEWQAIALNYTSGTTGDPKGVVTHHRGAFLNAIANGMMLNFTDQTVNLWTLPMFHCNGWCHAWGVTAFAGTHVLLRKVDPPEIFRLVETQDVTHMAGAPIVLNMILNTPDEAKRRFPQTVTMATGGAAPPSTVLAGMKDLGFKIVHLYGLTETYGPALISAWQDDWPDKTPDELGKAMSRQGLRHQMVADYMVADPETLEPTPADGETMGEIMVRGNSVMKGYLLNPTATKNALAGGWFHSGDLGVMHPDGYVQIKDRSKDIIISGGENISSLEVEDVLYRHPAVMEAAVVARDDPTWGETPCAFVTLKPHAEGTDAADIVSFCRDNMAHFKAPKTIVYGPLPKTATGKIQKFSLRERANGLNDGEAAFDRVGK